MVGERLSDAKRIERQGVIVLVSTCLVASILGSIHAFSVFLEPIEIKFGVSRSRAVLAYSTALIFLTLTVLIGPKFYHRGSPSVLMILSGVLAAGGGTIAAFADSFPIFLLGYGVVFGVGNGLGYGFGLQLAARYNLSAQGLAMGAVTAAYALGAFTSPSLFENALQSGGLEYSMLTLAITAALVCGIAGWMLVGTTFVRSSDVPIPRKGALPRIGLLWLGYFCAVLSGLMIIGHAAAIAADRTDQIAAWVAPTTVAAANLVGSLIFGMISDRWRAAQVLSFLSLVTLTAVAGLAVAQDVALLLISLALVGMAYGGTIAVYPAAISKKWEHTGPSVYGRVFTAWGLAGLAGPWLAGALFEGFGSYRLAFLAAGLISIGGILIPFKSLAENARQPAD